MSNMLIASSMKINDTLSLRIPLIGEIFEFDENDYLKQVKALTDVPFDVQAELDEIGIDYEKITEYELFLMRMLSLKNEDTSLLFEGAVLSGFDLIEEKGILSNADGTCVIDQQAFVFITTTLRKIMGFKKTLDRPANAEGKAYTLERMKKAYERAKKRKAKQHYIEDIVVSLVNTEEFPYNYETVNNVNIYAFFRSLKQIEHKKNWDQLMSGAYFGTVDMKKINLDSNYWVAH